MITVPCKELRAKFNEFFKQYEDGFVQRYNIKGQKTKGGKIKNAQKILEGQVDINTLYHDVIAEVALSQLDDPFYIRGFHLTGFEDGEDTATLVTLFFNHPELEITGELDMTCKNPVKQSEEAAWEDRCRELQHKHKYNEEYTKDELDEDGLEVLIDLIASDDQYTLRRKWLELSHLPRAVQKEIQEHKRGDLFETKYDVPNLKEGGTTELEAHIKIYDAKKLVRPEVNDELAVKEDFADLKQLKAQFQVDFDEYIERAKRGVAFNHMVDQIIRNSKLPLIPDVVIDSHAQDRINEHIMRCNKDKEKAMAVLGVKKWEDLEQQFRASVIRDILQQLAARKYAQMNDLPFTETAMLDHMANAIEWQDEEQPNE